MHARPPAAPTHCCPHAQVLACLCLINVLTGALLMRLMAGTGWADASYAVYGVLFRAPGFSVRSEDARESLVLNAIFLFGLFGFALLLSVITNEIKVAALTRGVTSGG